MHGRDCEGSYSRLGQIGGSRAPAIRVPATLCGWHRAGWYKCINPGQIAAMPTALVAGTAYPHVDSSTRDAAYLNAACADESAGVLRHSSPVLGHVDDSAVLSLGRRIAAVPNLRR